MFDKVAEILKGYLYEVDTPITPDSALVEDLGLNSLEVVNLVVDFEDEFGIEVPDHVIPTMHTVRDIVEYLEKTAG